MAAKVVKDEDKGFDAFFRGLRDLVGKRAKVGIQGKEAGEAHKGTSLTMVDLGVIHEFGAPVANIPERSFLRSTADQNQAKYQQLMAKAVASLTKRPESFSAKGALMKVGEITRKDIVNRMRRGEITPELAEKTKRIRKEDGPPLVDTGLLLNSISSVVE